MIPKLDNWEEVLFYCNPHDWSPVAMYEAVKMFISNLRANEAAKFLATHFVPRLREDIAK